ncbi:MAG: prepilin peptidase [Planctomycetaceae bacterium]
MMWFIQLPLEARLMVLAAVGLFAGAFANYLIYSWAYFPRHISPWAPPHPDAPARAGADRLPVLGWWGLRREHELHGRWFWLRPLLVEVGVAVAIPSMYWFYTQTGGLLPEPFRNPQAIAQFSDWGHALFTVHAVLLVLMVAATFIDFDEQTIPDIITLPGTLLALMASVFSWNSWLPSFIPWDAAAPIVETTFHAPWAFDPKWLGGLGLSTGLLIWSVWCFALADRHCVLRHGWVRAVGYLCHGIQRNPTSKWLLGMWVLGAVLVAVVWSLGDDPWRGLLTSLVGLAVGGGVVWAVRIVASAAMGQEAMGFGDVTLMAMIGAVVGWQGAVIAFFLAPMVAIVIVLIQFVITRQAAVPFGPYLCLATVIAVVSWDVIWNQTFLHYVLLGQVLIWVLTAALTAMGVMLVAWAQIKRWFLA